MNFHVFSKINLPGICRRLSTVLDGSVSVKFLTEDRAFSSKPSSLSNYEKRFDYIQNRNFEKMRSLSKVQPKFTLHSGEKGFLFLFFLFVFFIVYALGLNVAWGALTKWIRAGESAHPEKQSRSERNKRNQNSDSEFILKQFLPEWITVGLSERDFPNDLNVSHRYERGNSSICCSRPGRAVVFFLPAGSEWTSARGKAVNKQMLIYLLWMLIFPRN